MYDLDSKLLKLYGKAFGVFLDHLGANGKRPIRSQASGEMTFVALKHDMQRLACGEGSKTPTPSFFTKLPAMTVLEFSTSGKERDLCAAWCLLLHDVREEQGQCQGQIGYTCSSSDEASGDRTHRPADPDTGCELEDRTVRGPRCSRAALFEGRTKASD